MKIDVLCTDEAHPVNRWLKGWVENRIDINNISIHRNHSTLIGGDLLFLVSCSQLIKTETRELYAHVFVLHASDLPKGRGWSPHIWELLDGATQITLSLLEADDDIDTGDIWRKRTFDIPKSALFDEINAIVFSGELSLMDEAIELVSHGLTPVPQDKNVEATYYPKRRPRDSEIDPSQPLSVLFNKIRLMDPHRYPAFFRLMDQTYTVEIRKIECPHQ